jgi:hypothetical protein
MSFQHGHVWQSLIGINDPTIPSDITEDITRDLTEDMTTDYKTPGKKYDFGIKDNYDKTNMKPFYPNIKVILSVIITAVIFVTILSIYDVLRTFLNNYYLKQSLLNSDVPNKNMDEINSFLITSNNTLMSVSIFCAICILIALIVIPVIFYIMTKI